MAMTPSELAQAQKKTNRYGHNFDIHVDRHLPADLVYTKAGHIAKRQPYFNARKKAYYQAQCSFRGLKTSGNIDELQELLKFRDVEEDDWIKQEIDAVEKQISEHYEEERKREAERYWNDPSRTLQEKVVVDTLRALRESLEREDLLREDCCVFQLDCGGLKRAAVQLGLTHREVVVPSLDGESMGIVAQVVGQEDAVEATVKDRVKQELQKQREEEAKRQAELARREAAGRAMQQELLNEARQMPDWDLTGDWVVECDAMAEYSNGPDDKAELTMEIWRDEYSLDNPHSAGEMSSDEEDEDEEDEEDPDVEDLDPDDDGTTQQPSTPFPTDTTTPRFAASFDFAIIEGIMRIYPATPIATIKSSPTFSTIWRGTETGNNEIMIEAEEYDPANITFGNHGTTFEGTFRCPFIGGLQTIKGRKVKHGRGWKGGSDIAWGSLSQSQWNRQSRRRWGRW